MITPARPLTGRQRLVLDTIVRYYRATGEPCTVRYLARRLGLHPSTIGEHLSALYRKGWLPAPAAPRRRKGVVAAG